MKLNANETECTILRKNEADQELRLNTAKIVINGKETAKIRKNEIKTITEGDKVTHIVPRYYNWRSCFIGAWGYEYPELVSRQMIINFAHKWNDTPVVIYHTWDSAKELETIEASLVGRIYKPEILMNEEDDDFEEPIRLLVELHINEAWLLKQKKGKDTLDRILRGEMIEVSSGYYLTKFLRQSGNLMIKISGVSKKMQIPTI